MTTTPGRLQDDPTTIPCVGGPCDGMRGAAYPPEFTGYNFGHNVEATYRVNEAGTAAVFVEGTEREIDKRNAQ